MPFMDGTGPLGNGPGSGRGRGVCTGARRGFGLGAGLGRGNRCGMGFGRDRQATLEQQASMLERLMGRVRQRMSRSQGGDQAAR